MQSIKEVFYIGHGPSSSHTIGPYNATKYILNKYQNIKDIKITLFGSLASTGKGHLTDYVLDKALKNIPHIISFNSRKIVRHPNTMLFEINLKDGSKKKETIISIGGGVFKVLGLKENKDKELYPHQTLSEIIAYCRKFGYSLDEYVLYHEGEEVLTYIDKIYKTIKDSIDRGIKAEGELPGELHVKRKAKSMYENIKKTIFKLTLPSHLSLRVKKTLRVA